MLPIFARATGRRVWRNDMYRLEVWEPDEDEAEHGLRTEFADGIYIVTLHEDTPTDWLDLARRVSVATYEQHPGPDFMPASNYDSAIAVADRRVVGGTLVRLESAPRYRWKVQLRPDGEAYTADDLFGAEGEKCGLTFSPAGEWPPATYRSEEHTSELQSLTNLVCRLLLEKKKKIYKLLNTVYYIQIYITDIIYKRSD